MGRPQYVDQNNQLIYPIQLFELLKLAQNFPFSVKQTLDE